MGVLPLSSPRAQPLPAAPNPLLRLHILILPWKEQPRLLRNGFISFPFFPPLAHKSTQNSGMKMGRGCSLPDFSG